MTIEWTPWFNVPMHRRLEVLAVAFLQFCGYFSGLIATIAIIYFLCFGGLCSRIVCLSYLAFMLYDRRTCDTGGRGAGVSWWRGLGIWKHILNYFPIDRFDLPSDRNYLICIFPHGILSFGATLNFGTSHSKWAALYPRIRPKMTTLRGNFMMPAYRELLFSAGFTSASEKALKTLLTQSNDPVDQSIHDGCTANAVGLIVGGAREIHHIYPDTYKLVVAKRRGFVRVALETGASLVPAISFGENNVYKMVKIKPECLRRTLERLMKSQTDHVEYIHNGRGFLQYNFGIVPIRHPINTVIGAPIHLEKVHDPSDELIEKTHQAFCTQLNGLFEAHKSKYVNNHEDVHLEFV